MSANLPPDRRGSHAYGYTRRWTVAADATLVVDLRNQDRQAERHTWNPYIGTAWAARPLAEGGAITVQTHLGELDPVTRDLDADGWHDVSLPSGDDTVTYEDGQGEGDGIVTAGIAAIRFLPTDADALVWVALGKSPFGIPIGGA